MVSEHSGRGVSLSLCRFHQICSSLSYIIDRSVRLCCFFLDLSYFIFRRARSIVSRVKTDRSKNFDQVLKRTFRILVDYGIKFARSEVVCVLRVQLVLIIINLWLFNLFITC